MFRGGKKKEKVILIQCQTGQMNCSLIHFLPLNHAIQGFITHFILLYSFTDDLATEKGGYCGFDAADCFSTFLICIKYNLMEIFSSQLS